jgi:hypothetical protein
MFVSVDEIMKKCGCSGVEKAKSLTGKSSFDEVLTMG